MPSDAFVTLLTTSSYLPGALVLLHALHALHPAPRDFQIIALVTPETVDAKTIGDLRKAGYDLVIGVEPIGSGKPGQEGLDLMGRPDLNLALTKLHLFRLSALFSTLIYLDADVLPLRPLSHLFTSTAPHPLSACPDTGWPDCFNSGVMVIRPRESDWLGLKGLLKSGEGDQGIYQGAGGNGSFDGADQGLLNEWFSEEGGGGQWNRLSFTYNVTPTAAYTYAPAYRRYGHKINAVHFIGPHKPWANLQHRPAGISRPANQADSYDYPYLIDRWYEVYDKHVRPLAANAPDQANRFAVPENVAVWNRVSPGQALPQQNDRLNLDALKAATQQGSTSFRGSGQYISLPLDGRVDLLMPKPKPKRVTWSDTTPSSSTSAGQPAPPTGPTPPASRVDPLASSSPQQIAAPLPQSYEQQMNQPKTWDAAHFPPPKHGQPEMKTPMNTYYKPAWDQPSSTQASYFQQPQDQPQSQYPTLPANVRQDNWYKEYTHTAPNRDNVHAVFPWETQGQRRAERVFPRGDSPKPYRQHKPSVYPSLIEGSPETSPEVMPQQPSPPPANQHKSMAQAMASYKNAWDADPRIGRYVNRLTGGSSDQQHGSRHGSGDFTQIDKGALQSNPGTPSRTPQAWIPQDVAQRQAERSDASEDGDDEDDGDDEPDTESSPGPNDFLRAAVTNPALDQSLLPEGQGFYKANLKYRDRNVQTDRPASNDAKVQAYPGGPVSPTVPTRPIPMSATSSSTSTSTIRGSGSGSGSGPGRKGKLALHRQSSSSDTPRTGSNVVTPLSSSSFHSQSQSQPQSESQSHTPTERERRSVPFPKHGSSSSSRTISPPIHDSSITDPNRPVSVTRIFDPSTDVDMRKRDSHQVLSRFMQVGAFAQSGGAGEGGKML